MDGTLIVAGLIGAAATVAFMFVPGARAPERTGSLDAFPPAEVPAVHG